MLTRRHYRKKQHFYRHNPSQYTGKQFGPYLILNEIARGGQGVVLRARHQALGHIVALKILLDPSTENYKRFRQEAKVLARVGEHPNILKIRDIGEQNGYPYVAFEFLKGKSIKQIVDEEGIPPYKWTTDVLLEVTDAVQHIHEHGIIHRDIKPHNIVIEEDTGRAVLIDFGLVKRDPDKFGISSLDRSKLTQTGAWIGTPAYMAPEQIDPSFGEVGPWTDVYALGATLYFMLTGKAPFEGASIYNILNKILKQEFVNPKKINPDL